jgi:hypothetical protein
MPCASSAEPVPSIPSWCWSSEWFEAVSQASQPVARMPFASSGGVSKTG